MLARLWERIARPKEREISEWHRSLLDNLEEKQASEGSKILQDRVWQLPPNEQIELSEKTWNLTENMPRTLAWKVHQFAFVRPLIAYDRHNDGKAGTAFSLEMLRSWWASFSATERVKENMPWHDHATALRLNNLLLLRSTSPHSDFLEDVCKQHGKLLLKDKFYNRGNNHGLDQSLALFECGHELGRPDMHRVATVRILDEIKTAFASDAGHVENSTGYHHFGINQVKSANDISVAYTGHRVERTGLLERAEVILAHMTRPDRHLPHIGDTQNFTVRRLPQPGDNSITLPESGWAFFRSGWDTRAVHGAFKCGYLSQSHRHDDDLSLSIFGFGEEWLIDGGLFAHQPKDPMRVYMRSAFAHSLPYVVGMKASRDLPRIGQFSKITDHHSTPLECAVTATTRMWDGFEAERTVRFDKASSSLTLQDRIRPLNPAAEKRAADRTERGFPVYGTRFLVAGDKLIASNEHGTLISGAAASLQIGTSLESKIIKGQTKPEIVGWRSKRANAVEPAFDLSFLASAREYDERFSLRWVDAR